MKTTSVLTAAVAALSTGVECRNLQVRATASAAVADDGITPRPTPPPGWDNFEPGFLFGRQASYSTTKTPLTMSIAPDNTCGWISGSIAVPYTCGTGATCGIVQAQKTFSGLVMCFNSVAYNYRFSCVDSVQYQASSCDHLCAENTQILKW